MTGQNKFVISIFEKLYSIEKGRLSIILNNCEDVLSKQDMRQLACNWIPVCKNNIKTKGELFDFILNEVKDSLQFMKKSNFRKINKAFGRLQLLSTKI